MQLKRKVRADAYFFCHCLSKNRKRTTVLLSRNSFYVEIGFESSAKAEQGKKYHCINYDGRHGCTFDYPGSAVVKLCAYPFETNNTTKAVDRCPCVYESNQEIERYYNKNLDKEMTLCVCRV